LPFAIANKLPTNSIGVSRKCMNSMGTPIAVERFLGTKKKITLAFIISALMVHLGVTK